MGWGRTRPTRAKQNLEWREKEQRTGQNHTIPPFECRADTPLKPQDCPSFHVKTSAGLAVDLRCGLFDPLWRKGWHSVGGGYRFFPKGSKRSVLLVVAWFLLWLASIPGGLGEPKIIGPLRAMRVRLSRLQRIRHLNKQPRRKPGTHTLPQSALWMVWLARWTEPPRSPFATARARREETRCQDSWCGRFRS
jgi:hypothetical protein